MSAWIATTASAWAAGGRFPCLTRVRAWVRAGRWLLGWALAICSGATAAQPLHVPGTGDLPLWPGVTVWVDAPENLSPAQAWAERDRYARPTGTPSNLGRRTDQLWLRLTLQVQDGPPVRRVLEFDYTPLNEIDVYLRGPDGEQRHWRLGNSLRLAERPLASRAHALPLTLVPGGHEVLVRVRSESSMILPMTLRGLESFMAHESRVHLVQGIVLGLGLCMLLYSLTQGVGLRDAMFLDYALLLGANVVFTLAYFGIGALYLWPDWPALSRNVAPMAVLVAVAAGSRFMSAALVIQEISPRVAAVLRAVTALAVLGLVAMALQLISYRAAQTLVTVLGLMATTLVLPVAYVRARRRERAAYYMLFGWAAYTVGALVTAGLLRGWVEPTRWIQHVYPLSVMVEMAAWMAMLSLRVQAIHRNADRARMETEAMRALAQTDALTGLPNRRSLQQQLSDALPKAGPQRLLAVYLMDLDGFKPVNDRHGHDVGDALLQAVGRRLQEQLRASDVVARLGGDEFVVLAAGLPDEGAAQALGHKLLTAFERPFDIDGLRCEVGLTVGYALAPLDGHDADDLIKRADAAMYAGKQAGGRRLQRGGRKTSEL